MTETKRIRALKERKIFLTPFQGFNILYCKIPRAAALGCAMIPFQGIYSTNALIPQIYLTAAWAANKFLINLMMGLFLKIKQFNFAKKQNFRSDSMYPPVFIIFLEETRHL